LLLTRRIELILFVLFLLLTLVSVGAYRLLVFDRFLALESALENGEIDRLRVVIAKEIDSLALYTEDWASWDDAYAFMVDASPDFVESNLTDSTYEILRLNLIMFIDNTNRVHYQGIRDYKTLQRLQLSKFDKPSWRKEYLFPGSELEDRVAGIVETDAGPMILVSLHILRSNDAGPSRGILVFGRLLTPDELA